MKLGLISDIHGNLPGLRACCEYLEEENVDEIVCLGDLVQFGPFPSEVISFIREHEIDTVQGNCDRTIGRGRPDTGDEFENFHWEAFGAESLQWTDEQLSREEKHFLSKLPPEIIIEMESKIIHCTHASPGRITEAVSEGVANEIYDNLLWSNPCSVLAVGHSHGLFLAVSPSGMIVNPGSVGGGTLPGQATLSMVEVGETGRISISWQRIPFDTEEYITKYREAELPEIFLNCILLGRDPRGTWHTNDHDWRQKWAEL